jgi:hypothetical protein
MPILADIMNVMRASTAMIHFAMPPLARLGMVQHD